MSAVLLGRDVYRAMQGRKAACKLPKRTRWLVIFLRPITRCLVALGKYQSIPTSIYALHKDRHIGVVNACSQRTYFAFPANYVRARLRTVFAWPCAHRANEVRTIYIYIYIYGLYRIHI